MHNNTADSFPKRLFHASRNVFWIALWLASVSLILSFPLHWLFGDSIKPVRMAFYITPWLLSFSLPSFILAVWRRRKWLSLVLAIASLTIIVIIAPLFLPKHPVSPSPNDFFLKVMTYNMHGIEETSGLIEVIRREKPDILLIQEYSPALVSPSFHDLDDLYAYVDVAGPKSFDQAVFSRYPLTRVAAKYDEGRNQKVMVETPAGPIAIWNVHPIPPYVIPPEIYDAQISSLVGDISKIKGPTIVAGDLNATDQSEAYHKINNYLKDAYKEAGWGFGFSYPAPPYTFMNSGLQLGPLWRIDHIFHTQDFIAASVHTLKTAGGSDHFPVVAELWLKYSGE